MYSLFYFVIIYIFLKKQWECSMGSYICQYLFEDVLRGYCNRFFDAECETIYKVVLCFYDGEKCFFDLKSETALLNV